MDQPKDPELRILVELENIEAEMEEQRIVDYIKKQTMSSLDWQGTGIGFAPQQPFKTTIRSSSEVTISNIDRARVAMAGRQYAADTAEKNNPIGATGTTFKGNNIDPNALTDDELRKSVMDRLRGFRF